MLALGYSRGSEAALLAADYFPQVFHGAIVYSPSSFASPAQNDSGQPAWTLEGKGIVNVPHQGGRHQRTGAGAGRW